MCSLELFTLVLPFQELIIQLDYIVSVTVLYTQETK